MLSWYYLTMLYLHNRVHDARLTAIIRSRRPNGGMVYFSESIAFCI